MDISTLLARSGPVPTRGTLIGVGQFGRTLLMQSRRIALLDLRVLCDLNIDRMTAYALSAGLGEDDIVATGSRQRALAALEAGQTVLTDDPELAVSLPADVVVEATGNAEAGARNVEAAIGQGRHVCLVSKETDSVAGPILARRAAAAGVVLSQVDGDQPSLLLGLLSRARALGLKVAGAGKSSEHDFVWSPSMGRVRAQGLEHSAPFPEDLWASDIPLPDLVARRADALSAIPQRTPPDFCEMCLVANASGLRPDRPEMIAAIARPLELPDLFRGAEYGGAFTAGGTLDIFNCLRRDDEISAAGGVFAVLETPDADTGELFRAKGIPVSRDARHVLVYNPTHLLGVEAPMSIMVPHRLGLSTGAQRARPVCDVAMRADRDFAPGERLADLGHHHRIEGISPLLTDYAPLGDAAAVPYFLAIEARLARPVRAGAMITCGDIELPAGRLLELRREQDATEAWT
ncbi:flagellar biosynthesis protein FlgA [Psychromarinibacter sp. C21-152]|uniref:Flagellar biosynthesis protein FlgA n=1 Tax=Psychromarinibacter sediminicola TaxID=3033385 RepID=A0AAE3T7I0_9RHOB|nr:flagellar biosynthesis protein FlgA [Psychromarinibacter sediminicola]MDF0599723.1 flagellar biosynthesis protein FlgA [Psychromarinibacter sediminicola]